MQEYIDVVMVVILFFAMLLTAYVTGASIEQKDYRWACVNFFIALYWLLRLAVLLIKLTFIHA